MNVTIAGAGVIGCAIAHELAARGARVRVLDGRGPGGGATRASAGILAPYIEGHDPAILALGVRSLDLYDEFVRRVVSDSSEEVEYERNGTLEVAITLDEAMALRRRARALAGSRIEHALLDAGDVRRLEPEITPAAVAGLHVRAHGYVAAGGLTRALTSAAMRLGAAFDIGTVASVEGGSVARVRTADAVIESDAVIIAAGSWSSGLGGVDVVPEAVKPIRGQLLQLRLPSRAAERVIWGSNCYLVARQDGTVLAGATVEDVGFDERATSSGVQELLEGALSLMPVLRGAAFEEVRVGLRPRTRDELPAVGASSTMRHVFYATGHYRNGVLLAPLTARVVADLVLDGKADESLARLDPRRLGL
ncbi:MAG TPA: glycine oxidase ThiO [Vicinamibacterales bacterium]|nr:glycine oxidase ThiO [Vicinamibacterales bacterium]